MMKKAGLIHLVFYLFMLSIYGQHTVQHEYVGTIQLIDKSVITYKISFDEYEDGRIEGKSITDFSGDHRTESRIVGNINKEASTITFNETENLTTKSDMPSENFCYVHLYNAKINLKDGKNLITGHFYGRYKDGSKCVEGDIYMMGDNVFFDKMKDVSNKRLLPSSKKEMIKEATIASKENIKNTILKQDENFTVRAFNDDVMIRLWDGEQLDGDRVSVYQDGKRILNTYPVKKAMKQLLVSVKSDTTVIRIVAETEGRIPPNTAQVSIHNNDVEVPIKLNLSKGKEATITIVRE